jgi:hypothetical protein
MNQEEFLAFMQKKEPSSPLPTQTIDGEVDGEVVYPDQHAMDDGEYADEFDDPEAALLLTVETLEDVGRMLDMLAVKHTITDSIRRQIVDQANEVYQVIHSIDGTKELERSEV